MGPENRKPPGTLEKRLRFETLLAEISSRFVSVPADQVDDEIKGAQRRICEFLDLDRSTLWQVSPEQATTLVLTHVNQPQGIPPATGKVSLEELFPWTSRKVLGGETVIFSRVSELPLEAGLDRQSYTLLGTKSDVLVPLSVGGGAPFGLLTFAVVREERDWPATVVKGLQLIAQVFANALARKYADRALRESEEVNRATFEQAAVGIAHVGIDGRWLRVNDKLCAIVGYSREELLRCTFQDITHPDDLEIDLDYVHQVLSGEIKTYSMEKRYIRKDRSLVWINLTVSLVRSARGDPRHFISVVEDITDRRRAEDAFRASEARLEAGVELAGLGYYEINFADQTTFIQDRFHDICGVPSGPHKNVRPVEMWMEQIHPDDRERVLEYRQKLQDGRLDRLSLEYRYLHPEHGMKWLHHVACVSGRNDSGRAVRTYGVVRDITETKQMSERIQSAATEWQTTFDSINDPVMILDSEYRIVRVNAATVRFLGLPLEQIVGSFCYTAMHGTSCPIIACPCQVTFQSQESAELEMLHAGTGRWLLVSTDLIRDAAGKATGVVHVCRDITEAKNAEAELLRQRTELAHVARVTTMGELAASLAHELNQPLSAIFTNAAAAEVFLRQDPPALDELREILADIREDDKRASEVIRRLRALFRRGEMERLPLEINSLVEDVWLLINREAEMRRISLIADLARPLPKISGDRIHLQQVLLNLILNSMDAIASRPRKIRSIAVRTRLRNCTQVELSVMDTGLGIGPDELPHLFEPFYTTKPTGIGMGLSIAQTIITAHQGHIWAENNEAGGATFIITLPACGDTHMPECKTEVEA